MCVEKARQQNYCKSVDNFFLLTLAVARSYQKCNDRILNPLFDKMDGKNNSTLYVIPVREFLFIEFRIEEKKK